MKLRVLTPTQVVFEQESAHITVEDPTGSLGIRPGHAPLVSSLVQTILVARPEHGAEQYVAVNGGVLLVSAQETVIVSRQAVVSRDLHHLETTVMRQFEAEAEADRSNHTAFEKMRFQFLRQVLEYDDAGTSS